MNGRVGRLAVGDAIGLVGVAAALVLPFFLSDFHTLVIGVRALWLGMAAMSLIYLAGYCGMISLGQTAIYGVAGLTMANLFIRHGWADWPAVGAGIVVAVVVGLVVGAVASRSEGIYFLMLTLAVSVLVNKLFEQEPKLSGHAGISDVRAPALVGDPISHQVRFYYVALGTALVLYLGVRYLVRTPFGIACQGIRDEPVRMRALGFNVSLYRTLAFGIAAFVAAIAGIYSTWYNTEIAPASIDLTRTNDVLIVAVIGGLTRLEGAWIGAVIFAVLDNFVRDYTQRFDTVIGFAFLLIVLLSPGGVIGIGESLLGLRRSPRTRESTVPAPGSEA